MAVITRGPDGQAADPSRIPPPAVSTAASLRCRATPVSVSAARRFVADQAGDRPDADVVLLLVSELATNAVIHARTPFDVTVVADADGTLRVEVRDRSRVPPRLADAREGVSEWGRGLRLVDALATRWGFAAAERGKCVWFEMTGAGGPRRWIAKR